jgi:hypothetical protein
MVLVLFIVSMKSGEIKQLYTADSSCGFIAVVADIKDLLTSSILTWLLG